MLMVLFGGFDPVPIVLLALTVDAVVGDPRRLYRIVPHPTAVIGRLIAWAERRLNQPEMSARRRARSGSGLTIVIVVLAAWAGLGAEAVLVEAGVIGWLIAGALASTLLAFRGLYDAAREVAQGLDRSLDEARDAVRHMVGRDPASLDAQGVARAAVESVAENFSDGVVAPAFWCLLLGLPGLAAYKAINTLDSMIGHRDARYEAFGRAAARLDDWVNWAPARIAGALIVAAAAVMPGASPRAAWRTMRADAPKHRSPSAGWQEAAMAGALGYALAGPRRYPGVEVDDPWMGDGRRDLGADDIRRSLHLYLLAGLVLAVAIAAAWGLSRL